MRSLLAAMGILVTTMAAHSEMDTSARRDYIAACMFAGGFIVSGEEPEVFDKDGVTDIERIVKSWIDSFEKPEEKFRAAERIESCLKRIIDASNFESRNSRIEALGGETSILLVMTLEPLEYAKGIICSKPDARHDLALAKKLLQFGVGGDEIRRQFLDAFLGAEPLSKAIMDIDLEALDCTVERICEIRGSVPVEVQTGTMDVFGVPMRQVKVLAGQCEEKTGFVNEGFITF